MIELEKFSVRRSLSQASEVKGVVDQERERLVEEKPGTARRFRDMKHSAWNVARIAANESLQAYIVKRDGVARGLATVIFGQRIEQVQTGQKVSGSDIDYWLVRSESDDVHFDTVRSLVSAANTLESQHNQQLQDVIRSNGGTYEADEREHTVFATEPYYSKFNRIGFAGVMNEVGPNNGAIKTLQAEDKLGVARGGSPCQLYVA